MDAESAGFGHRPHVVHAADAMNLKSRPPAGSFLATCCLLRVELVALEGAEVSSFGTSPC
jgi:hypothetical protein